MVAYGTQMELTLVRIAVLEGDHALAMHASIVPVTVIGGHILITATIILTAFEELQNVRQVKIGNELSH